MRLDIGFTRPEGSRRVKQAFSLNVLQLELELSHNKRAKSGYLQFNVLLYDCRYSQSTIYVKSSEVCSFDLITVDDRPVNEFGMYQCKSLPFLIHDPAETSYRNWPVPLQQDAQLVRRTTWVDMQNDVRMLSLSFEDTGIEGLLSEVVAGGEFQPPGFCYAGQARSA